MKTLSFLFALLFVASLATAQTIVKTNPIAGTAKVSFNFAHQKINTKIAGGANLQIEIEVRSNLPKAAIDQLVNSGRYKLVGTTSGDVYSIAAPNLTKAITIDGKPLQEEIIINLTMPNGLKVSGKTLSFKTLGQTFGKTADVSVTVKAVSTAVQQRQAGFGEILIDGVKFEVE